MAHAASNAYGSVLAVLDEGVAEDCDICCKPNSFEIGLLDKIKFAQHDK